MFKLTALLCAVMFSVLLIAGEDRGQVRPGLANAPVVAQAPIADSAPQVVLASAPVAAADAAPADIASVSAPVSVTPAAAADADPAADQPVFSLTTYSDAATPPDAPQTAGAVAYVDAASVNVREGPGTSNPVLTRLTRGEAVTIVSTDDTGWARIRLEGDGLEGFMSMEFLSSTSP